MRECVCRLGPGRTQTLFDFMMVRQYTRPERDYIWDLEGLFL